MLSYQCRDEGEVNKAVHVSNISRGFASSSQLVLYFMFVCSETQKYGILEADTDLRVFCMKEKPLPSETKSRRAVSSTQMVRMW